jgi:hypothetical protein
MLSTYKVNPNKKFESNQMIDRPLIKKAIGKIMMDVILDLVEKNPMDSSILVYTYNRFKILNLSEIRDCRVLQSIGSSSGGKYAQDQKIKLINTIINKFISQIFLNFDATITPFSLKNGTNSNKI